MKKGIFLIVGMFVLVGVLANVFTQNSQSDFNNGTYEDTVCNSSGVVQLSSGKLKGNYTSQIFYAYLANWHNISWESGIYQKGYPDNEGVDSINMSKCLYLIHMDEASWGSGNYDVHDSCGKGYVNFTSYNGANTIANGKFLRGGDFDGINDYVYLDDPASSANDIFDNDFDERTFEIWYNPRDLSGTQFIFEEGGSSNGVDIYLSGSTIYAGAWAETNGWQGSWISTPTSTGWHHAVLVFKSSQEMAFYHDGVLVGNVTPGDMYGHSGDDSLGVMVDSAKMHTGDISGGPTDYFNGSLDEFVVYNRTLSQDEILERYKRGILRLNVSVRSCDDANCSGESWVDINDSSPQNLSIAQNSYFQYRVEFETENKSYSPVFSDVRIEYDESPLPDYNFSFYKNSTTTKIYLYNESTLVNLTFNGIYSSVELNGSYTGEFLSDVFDAGNYSKWNSIKADYFPWYRPLPDNKSNDWNFMNKVDMNGNVLLYHFESDGTIDDSSGESKDGNPSGVVFSQEGIIDKAIYCNGSSYVDVDPLSINDVVSVSIWFTADSGTWYGSLLGFGTTSSNENDIYLWGNAGNDCFGFNTWNSDSWGVSGIKNYLRDGNFHHIVAEFHDNDFHSNRLWIDGQERSLSQCTGTSVNRSLSQNFGICYNGFQTSGQSWHGKIDEVAVFNRSLSDEEVKNIYKRGILRLNVSVRSCDDANCSGEGWVYVENYTQNLSIPNNRYFQYKAEFTTKNKSFSPILANVTVNYEETDLPRYVVSIFSNGSDSFEYNYSFGLYNGSYYDKTTQAIKCNASVCYYASNVFDSQNYSLWESIEWESPNPSYEAGLPNNKTSDSEVDMSENLLLLHMDDSSGDLKDSSGEGNDGFVGYGAINYSQEGLFNKSIRLDGKSRIDIAERTSLDLTGPISYGAWIKADTIGSYQGIISRQHTWGYGYGLILRPNYPACTLNSTYVGATTTINTGQWYFLACIYNGSRMTTYLNGEEVTHSDNKVINSDNRNMSIGSFYSGATTLLFNGSIDEVFLLNRAISEEELLNIYKRGILRLNVSVRSCDDANCSGESWVDINDSSPQNLSIAQNRFFQYRFEFKGVNGTEGISIFNTTVNYRTTGPPSCSDGIQNQDETDVDCGGICGSNCADGKKCSNGFDCSSLFCEEGVCVSCSDGIKNNNETDVDCGGPYCGNCTDGKSCLVDSDCYYGHCGVSNATIVTLFSDDFDDGDANGWTVIDNGGDSAPSDWHVSGGVYNQSSNIFDAGGNRNNVAKGTYSYFQNQSWTDYNFSLSIKSTDDDGLGVMFRYQNDTNYYRCRWDGTNGFIKLEKFVDDSRTELDNFTYTYTSGNWYNWTVVVEGNLIRCIVEGVGEVNATDDSFSSGGIALYSWANQDALFDNISVTTISFQKTCVSCHDGIQNQGEDYIDCGGSYCSACSYLPKWYDDCGNSSDEPDLVQGTDFTWGAGVSSNNTAAEKSVSYSNDKVIYKYIGLNASRGYKLSIKYLQPTGGGRIQSLNYSRGQIHSSISIPEYIAGEYTYQVPYDAYQDGNLTLYFIKESGPNAVVSEIRVWETPGELPESNATWPFDNPSRYTYNSSEVVVENSTAKLLQPTEENAKSISNKTEFDEGNYTNTFYNSSGFIQLSSGLSGSYVSGVINFNQTSNWTRISWLEGLPYGEELPGNNSADLSFGSVVNMSGNVVLFHFDNNTAYGENESFVYDFSGTSNHGTGTNLVVNTTDKIFGGASMQFDGSAYINLGDNPSLHITGDQAIEFWIKPTDTSVRTNPYAKAYGGEGTITLETNRQLNYYYGTSGNNAGPYQGVNNNAAIPLNNWTHLVVVRDLTHMRIIWYMNGVVTANVSANYAQATASSLNAYVGTGYTNPIRGQMDEFALYNRTLSQEEIIEHYKRGILKLNISVRSCDDANCSGESWVDINDSSPQNLQLETNPYFQYKAEFRTEDSSFSPELYNTTINYKKILEYSTIETDDFTAGSNLAKWERLGVDGYAQNISMINYALASNGGTIDSYSSSLGSAGNNWYVGNLIDGLWDTGTGSDDWASTNPHQPSEWVVIKLPKEIIVYNITEISDSLGATNSDVKDLVVSFSMDGVSWTRVLNGTCAVRNSVNDFSLGTPQKARYVKINFTSNYGDANYFEASEIQVWGIDASKTATFYYSADSGTNWTEVPPDYDLSSADTTSKKIRIKARLVNGYVLDGLSVYYSTLASIAEANCSDGIKNQDETDVDCGGSCGACSDGKSCFSNSDCQSGNCTNYVCVSASGSNENNNGGGGTGGGSSGGSTGGDNGNSGGGEENLQNNKTNETNSETTKPSKPSNEDICSILYKNYLDFGGNESELGELIYERYNYSLSSEKVRYILDNFEMMCNKTLPDLEKPERGLVGRIADWFKRFAKSKKAILSGLGILVFIIFVIVVTKSLANKKKIYKKINKKRELKHLKRLAKLSKKRSRPIHSNLKKINKKIAKMHKVIKKTKKELKR